MSHNLFSVGKLPFKVSAMNVHQHAVYEHTFREYRSGGGVRGGGLGFWPEIHSAKLAPLIVF